MKYFVIGYPCSGKTSFAKWFSKKTSIPYIDIDDYIEEFYHHTISELFETKGEEWFRDVEYKVLRDIVDEDIIISCGGGLPCYKDNMDWMLRNGSVIWIDVPLATIKERLIGEELEKRPLMKKMAESGKLDEYIDIQYNKRKSYYQKANVHINEKTFDFEWTKSEHVGN